MFLVTFCISQLREKEIIQRSGYLLLTMDGGEGFVFLNTKKEKVDHSVGSLISEWTNTNNEKVYHFVGSLIREWNQGQEEIISKEDKVKDFAASPILIRNEHCSIIKVQGGHQSACHGAEHVIVSFRFIGYLSDQTVSYKCKLRVNISIHIYYWENTVSSCGC